MGMNSAGVDINRAVKFSTGAGCQGSPNLTLTPSSFTKDVPLNGTATDSLTICNTEFVRWSGRLRITRFHLHCRFLQLWREHRGTFRRMPQVVC